MKLYTIAGDTSDETVYMSKSDPNTFIDIIDVCCGQYIEEYHPRETVANIRYEYLARNKRRRQDPRLIDTMDNLPKLENV